MPYRPEMLKDIQHGFLWDMLDLEATNPLPTPLQMFQVPIGGHDLYNGHLKTRLQTNMVWAAMLAPPEEFQVQRILFTFSRDTSDHDMYDFAERAVWRFRLYNKIYLSSPLISLPTMEGMEAPIRICEFCAGVYAGDVRCPGCGASQFRLSSIGAKRLGRGFCLDLHKGLELSILNHMEFAVEFELMEEWRPLTRLKMWCHLEGKHSRTVQ